MRPYIIIREAREGRMKKWEMKDQRKSPAAFQKLWGCWVGQSLQGKLRTGHGQLPAQAGLTPWQETGEEPLEIYLLQKQLLL